MLSYKTVESHTLELLKGFLGVDLSMSEMDFDYQLVSFEKSLKRVSDSLKA